MDAFTEDDVGKRVENEDGEAVGVVSTVEGSTAYVDPRPDVVDSVKAALGWENEGEEDVPLEAEAVGEVTDDAIRIGRGRSAESADAGHDSTIERDEDAGTRDPGGTTDEIGGTSGGRPGNESTPSEERSDDSEDAPPEGDRTVTKDRGRHEDR